MATKQSIAQTPVTPQTPADGPVYNDAIGEYEIRLAGSIIAYASTQARAWSAYSEALRANREHVQRNPANRSILWTVGAETRVLQVAA